MAHAPFDPFARRRSPIRPVGVLAAMNRDSMQAVELRWWMPITEGPTITGALKFPKRYYGNQSFDADTTSRQTLAGTAPTWVVDRWGTHGLALDFTQNGALKYETDTGQNQPTVLPGSTNQLTVTAWVQADSLANYRGIVTTASGARAFLLVSGASGNPLGYVWTNSGNDFNAASGLNFDTSGGTWQFIALVVTPTAGTLYMGNEANGFRSFTNTETHSATDFSSAWDIILGDDRGNSRFWDGRIADVRIYERSLSAGELYQMWDPVTRWDLYRQPTSRWFAMAGVSQAASLIYPVSRVWMPLLAQ